MKKRKNIIISAITCLFSICLMMFGVYAASNPSVSISGQVSYSARDAKVLVLGKVNGQAGNDSNVDYPTVADATNPQENEKKVSASQYMGYTKGTSANDDTDNLAPWAMNATHAFYEDSTGIRPIVISFKMTNLSNYPVVATVDFTGVTEANLASKNLTRTTTGLKDSKVYLDKNVTKEISVTYSVANDAVGVNGDGLLNMSITFEKTVFPTPSNVKSPQGETMQSDWEYEYDGDSFIITRYKKTKPLEGETFEDPTIPTELVIPSSVVCSNGKTYPVKTLGSVSEQQFQAAMNGEIGEEIIYSGNVVVDLFKALSEGEESKAYLATLPTNIVVSDGIEILNPVSLMYATGVQELPKSIKSIGAMSCVMVSIQTFDFPNVTYIGEDAFSGCSFTSAKIPTSLKNIPAGLFSNCELLETVTLSDGIESIPKEMFSECTSLKSIEIPNSVTSIGDSAFFNCTSLASVVIQEGVTSIGDNTFYGCTSLASIEIPSSVTSIGFSAFNGCTSLASVVIPEGVTSIGGSAFSDCTSLVSIVIPEGVTNIGNSAFNGCTSLASVEIPSSVTSIGNWAFYNCKSLVSIEIPNSVTSIGDSAFSRCELLASIEIPSSVTSIGNNTFYDCKSLVSIEMPSSVTNIGNSAFYGCKSLASIEIPSSVTSIGNNAFDSCTSLVSIEIPSSVTSIGGLAFRSCNLTSLIVKAVIPPNATDNLLVNSYNPKRTTIYVPAGSVDAYKTANGWSAYADKIQAIA